MVGKGVEDEDPAYRAMSACNVSFMCLPTGNRLIAGWIQDVNSVWLDLNIVNCRSGSNWKLNQNMAVVLPAIIASWPISANDTRMAPEPACIRGQVVQHLLHESNLPSAPCRRADPVLSENSRARVFRQLSGNNTGAFGSDGLDSRSHLGLGIQRRRA